MKSIVAAILPLLFGAAALAYNPPSDTAGPLTVQMQPPAVGAYGAGGYADLSRAGVPFVVPVSLQNASDQVLVGTLRMAAIDGWKVAPADPAPFRIRPRGRLRQDFTLTFPPGTYNAHYPIHVYAEFEWGGQKLVAHPVMMVQPRIADLPRPKLPAEWRPVPIPKGGTLGLWRMPVRRERVEIANTGAEAGSAGREVFDAGSVVLYGALAGNREGIGMTLGPRPPSKREAVEAAAVEYPLALPAVAPLRLEFGSRWRRLVRGEGGAVCRWSFHHSLDAQAAGGSFEPLTVDLARYAGSSIRLRLEARDGVGEARWAEPTVVAGNPPQSAGVSARGSGRPPAGSGGRLRSPAVARLARNAGCSGGIPVRRAPAVLPRPAGAGNRRCAGGVARIERIARSARGAGKRARAGAAPVPQLGGRVRCDERDVGRPRCAADARVAGECAGSAAVVPACISRVFRQDHGARRPRACMAVPAM